MGKWWSRKIKFTRNVLLNMLECAKTIYKYLIDVCIAEEMLCKTTTIDNQEINCYCQHHNNI